MGSCLTPFQTVAIFSQKCQRFRFEHRFHLHDCRNDRVRKNGLGSIAIATSFRGNLPSPREDRLVLFTMAAAYTEMLVAVPHIEFIKGIPTALEQDFYFDVNKQEFDRV